jgi:hypothetical protein
MDGLAGAAYATAVTATAYTLGVNTANVVGHVNIKPMLICAWNIGLVATIAATVTQSYISPVAVYATCVVAISISYGLQAPTAAHTEYKPADTDERFVIESIEATL